MAILNIVKTGHPILRKKATRVQNFDEVSELILNMKETLKYIGASGLAAPQVMVSKRVIVYRVNKNRIPLSANFIAKPWTYMINPVIKPISKKKKCSGNVAFPYQAYMQKYLDIIKFMSSTTLLNIN